LEKKKTTEFLNYALTSKNPFEISPLKSRIPEKPKRNIGQSYLQRNWNDDSYRNT